MYVDNAPTFDMRLAVGQDRIYLNDNYPVIGVVSGVGFGKSHLLVRKHHRLCLINRASRQSLVGAPTYDLLKNNLIPMYLEHLDELGYREGKDYKVSYGSSPTLTYAWGHTVLFRPFGPLSTKRMVSFTLSHASIDESGQCAETTPIEVTKRVRCPKAIVRQICYYGTPEGVGNFFFRMFNSQAVYRIPGTQFSVGRDGRSLVLHGRTQDNPVLPEDYIANLEAELSWNPNLIKAYMLGEFVPLYDGSAYDFDPLKHKGNHPLNKQYPIYVPWDFNVTRGRAGGVSWVTMQELGGDLLINLENRHSSRTTYEAVHGLMRQLPKYDYQHAPIIITGDSSGWSRDTRGYGTDYDIIRQEMAEKGYTNVRIEAPHSNPSESMRIAAVNRLLSDSWQDSLSVDEKCGRTIDSLLQTTIDDTGRIKKPAGETHTHFADAVGYGVVRLRPIRKPWERGAHDIAFI